MRDARAADWVRRLHTRRADWEIKIQRFSVSDVPSIGTLEIPFQSPLTVFSGPNGVGKTTLLRAMWAAMDAQNAATTVISDRKLSSGTALVEILKKDALKTLEVSFGSALITPITDPEIEVVHIDSAGMTPLHQKSFCEFESIEEIINGSGARELNAQELAEVSFIVHRQYRSVTLHEVELGTQVPFFEVSYGDDRYDSRTMGAGELAALYLWWAVNRSEPNSILLIEEPEAFLSFGSQKSLASFIVSSIVQKRLISVVSSHSGAFIASLPKESLLFFTRTRSGVSMIVDHPPPVLLKEMGIDPPTRAIVFVEDSMGRHFCRAILEKYDPLLSRQIHVDQRSGHGEVVNALKPMMDAASPIRFIGLFDGDMRGRIDEKYVPISTFLPGNEPAESAFRTMIEHNVAALAAITGNINCPAIINSLEGKDHHDWYQELCRELGFSYDQLFSYLIQIWFQNADNEASALQTYEALEALININR